MERANHISSRDDAVGEWTTAMWAFVLDGEETIAEVEDGDVMPRDLNGTAFECARRKIKEIACKPGGITRHCSRWQPWRRARASPVL